MAEGRGIAHLAATLRLQPDVRHRLVDLCRRCDVKRLDLFGSAATGKFEVECSDLDFLVVFKEMRPAAYARAYFDLREGLVELFDRPIDLMTSAGLKNPHLMGRIEAERLNIYVG